MEIHKMHKALLLEQSSWIEENPDYELSNFFRILDSTEWQIGFYSKKTDRIIMFVLDSGKTRITEPSEVFKEPDSIVTALNLDLVKVDWQDAIDEAQAFQKDNFPKEQVWKTIFILQDLGKGPIYNITFVTKAFNTLNIRINASDKSLAEHHMNSLMDMAQFEKGDKDRTQDRKAG